MEEDGGSCGEGDGVMAEVEELQVRPWKRVDMVGWEGRRMVYI